ncbi:hypothetical protein ACJX0J_033659, partial [Zea mays]
FGFLSLESLYNNIHCYCVVPKLSDDAIAETASDDEEDDGILSPSKPSHIEFGKSTKLGYFGKNDDELIRQGKIANAEGFCRRAASKKQKISVMIEPFLIAMLSPLGIIADVASLIFQANVASQSFVVATGKQTAEKAEHRA